MPNVVGKTKEEADKALRSAGLNVALIYRFDSSVKEYNVISQSVDANKKVSKGTSVTIVISKGKEAPSGWVTDSSFVNSNWYTYEMKTQYLKQTRTATVETTTSSSKSLSGWTLYNTTSAWGAYGGWSSWSTTSVSASDSRQVETKQESYEVQVGTLWRYGRWTYWTAQWGWKNWTYSEKYATARQGYYEVTPWLSNRLSGYLIDNGAAWEYPYNGEYWYYEDSQPQMETRYRTLYRYRDRSLVYTYHYKRTVYGSWSSGEWVDTKPITSDTCQIGKTRTVYYYTKK